MQKQRLLYFGIGLALIFILFSYLRKDAQRLHHIQGQTMGTIIYNVKYVAKEVDGLDQKISDELVALNQSLSTYIPDSEISILNKEGVFDFKSEFFLPVLKSSKEIHENTDGTFDPSIGPLVQAWGFGPDKQIPLLDSAQVDSLKSITGFDKVKFNEDSISLPANFQIDFSAIAKGYAVDIVSELLEENGINNYLVEIGGEVRCRGVNDEEKSWSLGIEDPTVSQDQQRLMAIVRLKNKALATSGNYRNYYEKEGKIYAHIIDPRTGYTANHSLLSASVFASDCMSADAYATAFMVLGLERSKQLISVHNLDALLIYRSANGSIESFVSEGIRPFLEMNKAKGN
ncbi:thiamine biosynthesis lipoprotein [Ekhidna lutea]|uniref:FAD:protein FMN transferase n=1 Tax=Ekhidna lutea TaxID=447679 RepID=A0A239IXH4_EKHLU|nr:FAD:protein FMN transferase [Ekhidna lutea]SNS98476.1 thiamine biosynthesis lipoprotein [Ekhidna lutea]